MASVAAEGLVSDGRVDRSRWLIRLVIGLVIAMAAMGCLLAAMFVLSLRRTTVVDSFKQPDTVSYADGQNHLATLWHVTGYGTPIGLGPDHYEVLLGATDSYGHVVRLEATGFDAKDLKVEWEPEGAWLNYGAGHRIFVPAAEFLYGR